MIQACCKDSVKYGWLHTLADGSVMCDQCNNWTGLIDHE